MRLRLVAWLRLAACAASLAATGSAAAHEFWLLPDRFDAGRGQRVAFELRVGEGWPGDTLPRDPQRVVRFAWLDGRGERMVEAAPGADPAGAAVASAPGAAIVVYRSTDSFVELEADAFERYLRLEGLEAIVARRRERGESASPGRELFSRSAKALLQVDGGRGARQGFARVAGLTLELVPLVDPRRLGTAQLLTVKLLRDGRPLAGALVKGFERDGDGRAEARTDARGVARLALPRLGVWMFSAVDMTEAPAGSGAEWQSVWASLTARFGQ